MTIKIWFLTIKFGNKITSFEKNYLKMLMRFYHMNAKDFAKETVAERKKTYTEEIIRIKAKIDGACEMRGLRAEFSPNSLDVKIFQKDNLIKF